MTEKSVVTKPAATTVEKQPATTTTDKKSDAKPDKKTEKTEKKTKPETATHEGQKRVTDDYRSGWAHIWKKKN